MKSNQELWEGGWCSMGWSGKKKSRVWPCFGFPITRPCKIITKPPLSQPLFFSCLFILNIRSCALGLLCRKAKEAMRHMSSPRSFPEEYLWSAGCLVVFQKWCFIPSPHSRCVCTHSDALPRLHTDNFQKIQFCSPFPKQCLTLKVGTAELQSPLPIGSQGSHQEKEERHRKALGRLRKGPVCTCWCCQVMWQGLLCYLSPQQLSPNPAEEQH